MSEELKNDLVVPEVTEETKVEAVQEQESDAVRLTKKYGIKHHSRGTYRMKDDDTSYPDKDAAIRAAHLRELEEVEDDVLGDKIPAGYENYNIKDHRLIRESVMELPMNERYLADGSINPLYDREWVYAWAYRDRQDIATARSRGYIPVTPEDWKDSIKEGKVPQYVGDLVYEEGSFMHYGDSVLLRAPRFLWRQRREAQQQSASKSLTARHSDDASYFRQNNVDIPSDYLSQIGLHNSLEIAEV